MWIEAIRFIVKRIRTQALSEKDKPYLRDYEVKLDAGDRVLLDLVPLVLVEPGQVRRAGEMLVKRAV